MKFSIDLELNHIEDSLCRHIQAARLLEASGRGRPSGPMQAT